LGKASKENKQALSMKSMNLLSDQDYPSLLLRSKDFFDDIWAKTSAFASSPKALKDRKLSLNNEKRTPHLKVNKMHNNLN
jgi:hypothetical protein